VGLAELHYGLVAHYDDIGSDGIEQRGLLHGAQAFASGLHRGLGLPNGIQILKAFEDGLRERHRITTRMRHALITGSTCTRSTCLTGQEATEGWLIQLLGGGAHWRRAANAGNVTVGILEGSVA